MEKVTIEFTKEEFDKIIEFMDGGEYATVQQAIMAAVEKKEREGVKPICKIISTWVGISELVQCNDCAHGTICCGSIKCNKPGIEKYEINLHPVDWFCADGKMKEGR